MRAAMVGTSGVKAKGALGLLSLAWALGVACGGDEGGVPCLDALCQPGEAPVCVGQEIRTCAPDGRSYVYQACSVQQRCDGGQCVPKTCTMIGQATCATPTTVRRCADDGSGFTTTDCAPGETCRDGTCAKTSCTTDPDICTTNGFLKCSGGSWQQSTCPASQVCSLDGGVARCLPARCSPWATRCDGDVAKTCNARGSGELEVTCADDEICRAGHCQALVCGDSPTSDVVSDTSGLPDTSDPTSQLIFTLDGVATTFDQNAFASFEGGPRRLTIRASRSQAFLEIHLQPSNATVSGSYSSEIFNPVRLTACYKATFGVVGTFEGCPDGTTHRATGYVINLTRNDGPGGRIEGTFTLTMQDRNTDTIVLSNGQINVRYR